MFQAEVMEHEENNPAQSLVERQVQALTTSVQELTRQNQIAHATAYQKVNGQRKS